MIDYLRRVTVDTVLRLGVNRLGELRSQHVRHAAVPGTHGPVKVGAQELA